ncbi:MAG: aminopeptidase [Flavobacteriales bacterium]|nr:aminopeptidase [Flavobacteriales bacterium]
MKKKMKKIIFLITATGLLFSIQAQDIITNKEGSEYKFKIISDIEATEVQSQGRTGTCWSFSALSFIESEIMRLGGGKHELSEMFIVRNTYSDKADKYVRMHGNLNFGPGGAFHDVSEIIDAHGILPLEVYTGRPSGEKKFNHGEMDQLLLGMVKAVVDAEQEILTPLWKPAIDAVLDTYLGKVPSTFKYRGKEYSPKSFAKSLNFNAKDYVFISSFTHHPFYEEFIIEVPDNWMMKKVYNCHMDEMISIIDHALINEYSIAWASDVSEEGFSFRDGLALVPQDDAKIKKSGKNNQNFSDAGVSRESTIFETPCNEKEITQEMRQLAFDNYETTDDHGMHMTGILEDQIGKKYYIIKNSWGTNYNDCDGYFYASEAYVKYKTMNIMLHKDALSKTMRKKLNIQ